MISAVGLTKTYGEHRVLDGIDFSVAQGERVAVVGLNGAGKTTLFRCLLGLIDFNGVLEIESRPIGPDGKSARELIGYVPQRAPHFDGTVSETVEFLTELRGADLGAVKESLGHVGLSLEVDGAKAIRELSGGMLQKVLLGLALGARVPTLLLDEPTANLDPYARRDFLGLLRKVPRETTVLLASHRLADVEAVADRVLMLHDGKFVFDGTVSELAHRLVRDVTMWLDIPGDRRAEASQKLASSKYGLDVVGNNGRLGIRVNRLHGADVVHDLVALGIPIRDVQVDGPTLEDQLDAILRARRESADDL